MTKCACAFNLVMDLRCEPHLKVILTVGMSCLQASEIFFIYGHSLCTFLYSVGEMSQRLLADVADSLVRLALE